MPIKNKCAYLNCSNTRLKKPGLSFFIFPKDETRCKQWQRNCNNFTLNKLGVSGLRKHHVCAEHFLPDDFLSARKDWLRATAVPQAAATHDSSCGMDVVMGEMEDVTQVQLVTGDGTVLHPANLQDHDYCSNLSSGACGQDFSNAAPSGTANQDNYPACPVADNDGGQSSRVLSPVLVEDPVPVAAPASHPEPQAAKSKVLNRRGRNRASLPCVPRVPRKQQTPLVKNLLNAARRNYNEAVTMRKKYIQKCEQVRTLQRNQQENALLILRDKVSPGFFKLLSCEVRNATRAPRGRRYTMEEKVLFTSIQQRGPSCFRGMPFTKPTRKTMRKHIKKLNIRPGLNEELLRALKVRTKEMAPVERICAVILDEMAIKMLLSLDVTRDVIHGFVDLGNGDRRPIQGEEALIGMVRGVFGQWKLPISYWITYKKMTAMDFSRMFLEIIQALFEAGLDVRAIITDGLAKNILAEQLLGATHEKPYFFVDGHKILTLCDVPHLLKCLRNALLKYILQLPDGSQVDFRFIKAFVEQDMLIQPRMAKKITRSHLEPNNFQKMSVPLAAQVLSNTVAGGIMTYVVLKALPPEAMATGKFCATINDLFDSWNGIEFMASPADGEFKCAISANSPHAALWSDVFADMEHWEFLGAERLTFVKNWRMTTLAVDILWQDLNAEGHEYLPVGHLTQDCLENFNSRMRDLGGHRRNPSAEEFGSAFMTGMVNILTTTAKGKNCRDDNAINLMHITTLFEVADKIDQQATVPQIEAVVDVSAFPQEVLPNEDNQSDDEDDPDYEFDDNNNSIITSNLPSHTIITQDKPFEERLLEQLKSTASSSVAAPHISKFLQKTGCELCQQLLLGSTLFPLHLPHTLTSSAAEIEKATLPSASVSLAVNTIYSLAVQLMSKIFHTHGVIKQLTEVSLRTPEVQNVRLCEKHDEEEKEKLVRGIVISAIRDVLDQVNKERKKRKTLQKNSKVSILAHQ